MHRTENYVWYEDDLLGVGAVGEVYKGQCLKSGEPVAVKVMKRFDRNMMEHLMSLQDKECDVLRKMNHPNIVKLIAVESEYMKPDKKVIVLELCLGGNLYDIISKPENVFGLDDEEFLRVLHGIASGMKEVKAKNIIHRDIKPGNIMRYVGVDGRPIYKLIDFGAARELHKEEEFQSIYGTDEYLDPGLYEKAFIDRSSTSSFSGSVDLWSIGATLYHVAAGHLPFQAFKGRKDKDTMYQIIANKKSGQISGQQTKERGAIVYSEDLPKDCLISRGLRPLLVKLLASLLETKRDRTMSFESFFEMAECILNKKVISVFDSITTDVYKVYIDPDDNFETFQSLLHEQCQTPPLEQMLLFENLNFSVQFGHDNKLSGFNRIDPNNPVYSFSDPAKMALQSTLDNRKYGLPELNNPRIILHNLAVNCSESLNYFKRCIDVLLLRQKCINAGAIMLVHYLTRKFDSMNTNKEHVTHIGQSHNDRLRTSFLLVHCMEVLSNGNSYHGNQAGGGGDAGGMGSGYNSGKQTYLRQKAFANQITNELDSISLSSGEVEKSLKRCVDMWMVERPACKEEDCCSTRMDVMIKDVNEIEAYLRTKKSTDPGNIKKTELNRRTLSNHCKSAKELIEGHCLRNTSDLFSLFRSFMTEAWLVRTTLDELDNRLDESMNKFKLLSENFNNSDESRRSILNIKDADNNNTTPLESIDHPNPNPNPKPKLMKVKSKTNLEKSLMRKMLSITIPNAPALKRDIIPIAEENMRIIQELSNKMSQMMRQTSESTYIDKDAEKMEEGGSTMT